MKFRKYKFEILKLLLFIYKTLKNLKNKHINKGNK
jgi:hypothetical protein